MDDFISPIMSGLMGGLQIRGLIQHQRDQQEALQRQRFLDARNQRIQDLMLSNEQEDRKRKNNAADIAQTQELTQSGATPLQNGMLSQTMAPAAPTPSLSMKLSPDAGGAPTAPMTFGDPLASLKGADQPVTVTAAPDASRVVTANTGMQYQLPTRDEADQAATQRLRSKAQIEADAKRQEQLVTDPTTGKTVDARAVPILTNKSTVEAENTRSAAERTSREKIAGATDQRTREVEAMREAAADKRSAGNNATTLAAAKLRMEPKPLNPLEKAKFDTSLTAAMSRAERDFSAGKLKALQKAKADNPQATEKDIDPDVMNELITSRDRAKQDAHDGYREKLGGFGVDVAPIDFAGQTQQRMAGQQQGQVPPPAGPGKMTPGAPGTATAPKSQYKVGDIVQKGGKKFRVKGIGQDGKLQAEPL